VFEPRRDLAVPLRVEVTRRDGARAVDYAVNLSPGGLGLHLPRPLPVGEVLALAFVLPDGGPRLEAWGRVAWCDEPSRGARVRFCESGVRFEVLRAADRERISRFVAAGEAGR
jgi:uncharacterized protein (TIGR02266 family)